MVTQPEYQVVDEKLNTAGFDVPFNASRGDLLVMLQDIRRVDQRHEEFVDELREVMEIGGRRDDQLFARWLETARSRLMTLCNSSPEIDTEEHPGWFYERFEAGVDAGCAADEWATSQASNQRDRLPGDQAIGARLAD